MKFSPIHKSAKCLILVETHFPQAVASTLQQDLGLAISWMRFSAGVDSVAHVLVNVAAKTP
jgi:hypothetical protein